MVEAHRAALTQLAQLVKLFEGEPADYEMLGMCHVGHGRRESGGRGLSRRPDHRARRAQRAVGFSAGVLMKSASRCSESVQNLLREHRGEAARDEAQPRRRPLDNTAPSICLLPDALPSGPGRAKSG